MEGERSACANTAYSVAYCVIRLARIIEYHIENKLFCRNHHLLAVGLLQKILPPKQILSELIAIIQEIFERDLLVLRDI